MIVPHISKEQVIAHWRKVLARTDVCTYSSWTAKEALEHLTGQPVELPEHMKVRKPEVETAGQPSPIRDQAAPG